MEYDGQGNNWQHLTRGSTNFPNLLLFENLLTILQITLILQLFGGLSLKITGHGHQSGYCILEALDLTCQWET